jgi:hypothetical protein
MALKKKLSTPRDYIQVGMAFFLIGIMVSQVADGRLVGALLVNFLSRVVSIGPLQEFAAGLSIPLFCASIYFNVRGLYLVRSR